MLGKDVSQVILDLLNGGEMLASLNHTNIVLIPKVASSNNLSGFRPISLCNVVYKLATKVISNRLKPILPKIISPNQRAFTTGRLITDNILVSYEVFHSMQSQACRKGTMAIKMDMSKAYDRVEWSFLRTVMLKLGFQAS